MAEQDIYAAIRKLKPHDPEPVEDIKYGWGQNPNSKKNLRAGINYNNKGSSGKRYINDGKNMWKIPKEDPLPEGCYEGMIKGIKRTKRVKELSDKQSEVLKKWSQNNE